MQQCGRHVGHSRNGRIHSCYIAFSLTLSVPVSVVCVTRVRAEVRRPWRVGELAWTARHKAEDEDSQVSVECWIHEASDGASDALRPCSVLILAIISSVFI